MTEQTQQSSLLGRIAAYTEILAKDPKSTIFVSLAEAYRKMGMLDDARAVVVKGLETHSDFSPAHIVLARTLCQQGEYSASETSFQEALKFDSESLAALVGYSRLCILLGQEERARELLLEARDLSPADPVINKLLLSLPEEFQQEGVEEVAADDPDLASEVLHQEDAEGEVSTEGDEEEADAPVLVSATVAELYLKQGLTEKALEVYRQLSTDEPDNLLFRRKIRDLEDDFPGLAIKQEVDVTDAQEDPVPDEEIVEEYLPNEIVEKVETLQAEEPLVAGFTSHERDQVPEAQVLSTLNRWLDSIQQRREDV